jgi:uncharacterized protein
MESGNRTSCTAFEGLRCIATGELTQVAIKTKKIIDRGEKGQILIFDDQSGEQIEVDFRGTAKDVLERLAEQIRASSPDRPDEEAPRGPGRPKLGVVAREVTLLPRHWDWLGSQPGGASVALRKLVDEARRANEGRDRIRRSQEATYRFMSAIAGNLPGFEEATRALFAKDPKRFAEQIHGWPKDVRTHLARLVQQTMPVEMAENNRRPPSGEKGRRKAK